jgi:hypothetical protein
MQSKPSMWTGDRRERQCARVARQRRELTRAVEPYLGKEMAFDDGGRVAVVAGARSLASGDRSER